MASYDSLDITGRADALVCQAAVMLLRAGQKAGLAGEDLAPLLDRLLSVVSLELETDRQSIPTAVRCAAVQLAEHLVRRCPIPVPRGVAGGHEPIRRPPPDRGEPAATDRRSTIPFTQSIRLGRMG
jgi:hypothetical protein